jgi:hypothetical protein
VAPKRVSKHKEAGRGFLNFPTELGLHGTEWASGGLPQEFGKIPSKMGLKD